MSLNLSSIFIHLNIYEHSAQELSFNRFITVLCQIYVDGREGSIPTHQGDLITIGLAKKFVQFSGKLALVALSCL